MSECHYMSSDNLKVQLFVEEDIENVQTMIKCETCGDYGTVHKNDCDDCDGFGEIHYNHESDKVIDILSGVTEMCNKLEQLGYTHEESKELVVNTLINW